EQLRDFVPILNNGSGIVVVHEAGKQEAALVLCTQCWRYCLENKYPGFSVRFDRDIISDRAALEAYLRSLHPPCVGLSECDSAMEQLIQPADFLAGAAKLKLDFGTGRRNPDNQIPCDDDFRGT